MEIKISKDGRKASGHPAYSFRIVSKELELFVIGELHNT